MPDTAPEQNFSRRTPWKRLAIISASAGAGGVIGLSLVLWAFLWFSGLPHPWDDAAVTAKFKELRVEEKKGATINVKLDDPDLSPATGGTPLDVVHHPTLGTLKFPKSMSYDERNKLIAELEAKKLKNSVKGWTPVDETVKGWTPVQETAEHTFAILLVYDLTNTTMKDYELPIPPNEMAPMQLRSGSLLSFPHLHWESEKVWTTSPPDVLPPDFFDPKPILIPARHTIRVDFIFEATYSPEFAPGKSPQELAGHFLRDVDALVLLDSKSRYRIELPLAQFKKTK